MLQFILRQFFSRIEHELFEFGKSYILHQKFHSGSIAIFAVAMLIEDAQNRLCSSYNLISGSKVLKNLRKLRRVAESSSYPKLKTLDAVFDFSHEADIVYVWIWFTRLAIRAR